MSSGTTYVVTLSLQTTGNLVASVGALGAKASQAHGHVMSLRHAFNQVGEVAERIGHSVGGALEGIADAAGGAAVGLAKVGAGAALVAATYGVAKLNNNLEQTQISLGAIAQAQGFTKTFEGGFSAAGDQLAKMKQDVKTLPGDLGQLSDIMKMIATPAAQGGAGLDDIRKLAGRTMLTSTILGVPQEVASREMANLLAGRAGAHNILGSRLGFIGGEAKKFNAESSSERLTDVNKALDKYQGAADRFSHSFIANWTTLLDNFKYSMLQPATGGLFDRVKHGIEEANTYLDEHKEKVAEVASLVNRRLVAAWDAGENALKKYGPILGKYADQIAHMQPAEMAQKIEHAAKIYAGMKLGGMAISGGSSAVGGLAKLLGGIGGAGGAAAGLEAIGAAIPVLAAASLPAVAGLGLMAGAVDVLTNKNSVYHDDAIQVAKDIEDNWSRVAKELRPAVESAGSSMRSFGDYMGLGFLQEIDAASNAFSSFAAGLRYINPFPNRFGEDDADSWARKTFNDSQDIGGPLKEHVIEPLAHLVQLSKNEFGSKDKDALAKRGANGGGAMHVDSLVIRIEGAGDPSRIARIVMQKINEVRKNPGVSPHVPDYTERDPDDPKSQG